MSSQRKGWSPLAWIALPEYQVAKAHMGCAGLINSGGTEFISGRRAFQRPFAEGVELLHAMQDVCLEKTSTVA